MKRKIIVVTAAYGSEQINAMGGQCAVLPLIANAGADGVEIRRELLSDRELSSLPTLAATIEAHRLLACYSAPQALCLEDGSLNPHLPALLEEARTLKALWLKVSLGHYQRKDVLETLRGSTRAGWRWWWKTTRPNAGNWRPCSVFRPPALSWRCR